MEESLRRLRNQRVLVAQEVGGSWLGVVRCTVTIDRFSGARRGAAVIGGRPCEVYQKYPGLPYSDGFSWVFSHWLACEEEVS